MSEKNVLNPAISGLMYWIWENYKAEWEQFLSDNDYISTDEAYEYVMENYEPIRYED